MGDEHRLRKRAPLLEGHSALCLNCGASLSGLFCASCGQRDLPPYPSVRELAVDAVSEFSGWDGRLASTLRALIQRPGKLTHEFLEGRRVRYISPLRLYLMASLVYFLIAAAAPNLRIGSGKVSVGGINVGVTTASNKAPSSRPERVANAAGGALEKSQPLTAEERDTAAAKVRIAIANENGMPGEELQREENSPRVQALYAQYSREAEELGVFGAPTYVLDGERFWGQDRLEFLERALAQRAV